MDSVPLQSTIGGLAAGAGAVMTLLGEMDPMTGVLLIDAAVQVQPGNPEVRHQNCAAVSNNPASEARDTLFTEEDIRDAIRDYFDFAGRGLLVLDDDVQRFNPQSKIEADGLDDRGRKFRIAPDMTNGQLAVIVMCWFALRQKASTAQIEAFSEYLDFADDMEITSVGISDRSMGGLRIRHDGWPVE